MTETGELTGLAALVTGGGSGIGLATAHLLARRAAQVAVLDLDPGSEFLPLLADVSDDAAVRRAVDAAAGRMGGIDILDACDGRRPHRRRHPRQLR